MQITTMKRDKSMKRVQQAAHLGLMATICLATVQTASAHPGHALPETSPWLAGALHPVLGLDHLLAMLASGLLAVRIGSPRALWMIPLSFVALMWVGGGLALAGVPLVPAEWGIALSVIAIGVVVAIARTVSIRAGVVLIAVFAVCHGHAHAMEVGGGSLWAYFIGFTVATLFLHAVAIGFGLAAGRLGRPQLVRLAGAGIAASFALMLMAY